jgi:hypothetical protein
LPAKRHAGAAVQVRNTGYNRWADTNNLVMIYPDPAPRPTPTAAGTGGLSDSANHAKKKIRPRKWRPSAMVDQVSAGSIIAPCRHRYSLRPQASPLRCRPTRSMSTAGRRRPVPRANVYRNANKVARSASEVYPGMTPVHGGYHYSWTVKSIDANSAESVASSPMQHDHRQTPSPVSHPFHRNQLRPHHCGRAYALYG